MRLFFTSLVFCGVCAAQPPPKEVSRLETSAPFPTRMATVEVTYTPSDRFPASESLYLRARLRTADDYAYGWGTDTQTISTLTRDGGVYRGQFTYPDSVAYLLMVVATPTGDVVDTNLRRGWPLAARDAEGRILPAAYYQRLKDLTGRDFVGGIETAKEYTEVYPDDPTAWSMLYWFEDQLGVGADTTARLERVRRFDRQLSLHPNADRAAGLVDLSSQLAPDVSDRWTDWLMREAPAHPKAVQQSASRSRMANSESPTQALDDMESTFARVGAAERSLTRFAFELAVREGLRHEALLWGDRHVRAYPWMRSLVASKLAASPATRDEGVSRLRAWIADLEDDDTNADRRHLFLTVREHSDALMSATARARATLGSALLEDGDPAKGAEALDLASKHIWNADLLTSLADARLGIGDTLGAVGALARVAVDVGARHSDRARQRGASLLVADEWERYLRQAEHDLHDWTLREATDGPLAGLEEAIVVSEDGQRLSFGRVTRDGPTVLMMFSVDCGYSRAAMPRVSRLDRQVRSMGGRVVVVAAGPPDPLVREVLNDAGFTGPLVFDAERDIATALESVGHPQYFVFGQEGAVRFMFTTLDAVPRQIRVVTHPAEAPTGAAVPDARSTSTGT